MWRVVLAWSILLSGSFAWAEELPVSHFPEAESALADSGYDGVVLIWNFSKGEMLASDPSRIDEAYIPASTFKVMSSLCAMESGLVAGADTIVRWDGVKRSRTELNRDLSFRDAFQLSAVPHYQGLVRAIGKEQMQAYVDLADYGNRDLSGAVDTFWLTVDLRISPHGQVRFLEELYSGRLSFRQETMNTVREIMLFEEGSSYQIRAKTGLAVLEGDEVTGWWVGWVERGERVWFFATVLRSQDSGKAFREARLSVTRKALAKLGLLAE